MPLKCDQQHGETAENGGEICMQVNQMICVLIGSLALAGGCLAAQNEVAFNGGRPPSALPGECWCLFTIPAEHRTVSEQVLVSPAACSYEMIPAVFETRSERICVKPASRRSIETPAEYRTETYQDCVKKACSRKERVAAVYEDRTERVCVRPASSRKITIPAVYKTEEYRVCVAPSRTEWQRSDCKTVNVSADNVKMEKNECWCLVTIPGEFAMRTRQVLVEPARCIEEPIAAEFKEVTRRVCVKKECEIEVPIPAVYETRTRQVCVRPASKTFEAIPAEYTMVDRKVCVQPASKRRIDIPAQYETRTREVCTAPARQVWRKTECAIGSTNASVTTPSEFRNPSASTKTDPRDLDPR